MSGSIADLMKPHNGTNNELQLPKKKESSSENGGSNGTAPGQRRKKLLTFSDDGNGETKFDAGSIDIISEYASENKLDDDDSERCSLPVGLEDLPDDRIGWDNKFQFFLSVIGYAVGLGNVWRFPYLCQQNGGGAFLLPYCIMLVIEGMPLFLIEMGIGQRLRIGPVGVWNAIHPYLGGVGISSAVVSFLVALYYNVIIAWCLFYLFNSFGSSLPWEHCPKTDNGTIEPECEKSSETNYFWSRQAIDTTDSIDDMGGLNWKMTLCLIAAWFIVWICVMRGIKTSGKVMYVTATFPYLVMTIFFIRSIMLPGADRGIMYMFTPEMRRLKDPRVWLDAATQVFYSLGLGFGGLIAFSSYNPIKNNVKRDVFLLSVTNLVTSLYSAFIVFCILGYKGHLNFDKCVQKDIMQLPTFCPKIYGNNRSGLPSVDLFEQQQKTNFSHFNCPEIAGHTHECNFIEIMSEAAEGTGLAFIVFAQAMVEFPLAPLWAVMFFLMLLSLGLGSMFGTLEGVITSIHDLNLFTWLKKPILTGILCGVSCIIGLIFVTRAGEYWVKLFDTFSGSYALMAVAFFEVIGVVYVYGWRRFSKDLQYMTGEAPSMFWLILWRFVSPVIMVALFISSLISSLLDPPKYHAYNKEEARSVATPYPAWALIIAGLMICAAMLPVPFVFFARYFRLFKLEQDIPTAVKLLNTTPSTAQMLRSESGLNYQISNDSSENAENGISPKIRMEPSFSSVQS